MNITPLSPVVSPWMRNTLDVAETSNITSFSVSPTSDSSDNLLDSLMSGAVNMDAAEMERKQQILETDITTPEGIVKAGYLNHESLAGITAFGKLAGSAKTGIETLIKQQ